MNELSLMLKLISFTRILATSALILCALIGGYLWVFPMLGINHGTYMPMMAGLLFLFLYNRWIFCSGFKGAAPIGLVLSMAVGATTAGATLLVFLGVVLNMRGS